jgi:hypothetical protein
MPCAVADGTTFNLPPTAVTDAIIEVMRAREHKMSPPTFPSANGRRTPPPKMNRNHKLITYENN